MPDTTLLHTTSDEDFPVASTTAHESIVAPPSPQNQSAVGMTVEGSVGEIRQADTSVAAQDLSFSKVESSEEITDYSKYAVGELLDGVEIHHIMLQYADAIVFTTAKGSIHFRQNIGERGDTLLVEFYRLTSKSTARLKQAYARQVNGLLGAALAEALSLPVDVDARGPFKAVDEYIDSVGPIKHVFGATDSWVLFIDADGELVCDYPTVANAAAPLITEFYRLRELGKSSLRVTEVGALTAILGTELSIALQRTPPVETTEAFAASRDFIQLRNESRMRARYVSASLVAALAFGLTAWAVVSDTGMLLGSVGGIIGAAISVLQRSADLEIRRFLPPIHVIMQGAVRVTLGLLFGVLIVAASRAGVISEAMAATANAAFIAGVVAGFSERFVPDLLTKVAAGGDSSGAKK